MKQISKYDYNNKGFTLLEVIVSLIILSVFGAIFVSFFQTQISGSTQPIMAVQQGFTLEEIMERIKADYEALLITDATPLITLKANIDASPSSYGNYTAVTKFITFTSGLEDATACTQPGCINLKVTITIGDQILTTVFSR